MCPNHTPPKNCALLSEYYSIERCEYSVSQLVDDTEEDDEKEEEEEEEVQSSSLKTSHRETTRTSSHHYSVSGSGFGSFLRRRRGLTRDAASTSFPRARARRRRRPSVLRNGRGGRLRVAVGTDDVVAGESRNRFSDFPSGVRLGATVLRKSARKNATRPRGFSATAERFELRDERGTVRV